MKAPLFFYVFLFFMLMVSPASLAAQDSGGEEDTSGSFGFDNSESGDFGFGDFDSGESGGGFGFSASSGLSINIGGEVRAELTFFHDDLSSASKFKNARLGDIFSGSLDFEAAGSAAEAVIRLNLAPAFDGSSPVKIDEAFVRGFFGPVTVTGGLKKLTWGRADSFGPLDVINPLDYTDITKLVHPTSVKMARPMIHGVWFLGSSSKLEAVFVPWFEGHKFAASGRWMPGQIKTLQAITDVDSLYPETDTLEYAQTGLRFTTTAGSSDLGFQYYFGRLPRPAVNIYPSPVQPPSFIPTITYNYYHHLGADFARVIGGFNIRAELGANITSDLDGTDGTVNNPALVWALGFDRDLFLSINLNVQGTGQIRIFHDRINSSPFIDCEAGSDISSSRITGVISRKFFRDELELNTHVLWGIEEKDFVIMPGVIWTQNDVSAELLAGFFGGNKKGELGQYRNNGFIKMILSYSF